MDEERLRGGGGGGGRAEMLERGVLGAGLLPASRRHGASGAEVQIDLRIKRKPWQ